MVGQNVIQVIIKGQDAASPALASSGASATRSAALFTAAGAAIAAASVAMAVGIKKSIDAANELNREMANVGTLIPQQSERLLELRDAVQSLSVETNRSTTDIARGLYMTISALGDTAESMDILETASKAATAGLSEIPDAVRLITGTMKGYNDVSAEAAEKVADLAFETVRLGVTTFPELADSMGRVIPLAAALNVSQEELFASFATLTGVTGNAAMVTTQLSSIMRGFMKPTEDMKATLYRLGYATAEQMIKSEGLVGAMRRLANETDQSSTALAKLWENARGYPALFALLGEQAGTFDRKLVDVADHADALNKAFGEQTEGINKYAVEVERLGKEITLLKEATGEAFLPLTGESAGYAAAYVSLLRKGVGALGEMGTDGKEIDERLRRMPNTWAIILGWILKGVVELDKFTDAVEELEASARSVTAHTAAASQDILASMAPITSEQRERVEAEKTYLELLEEENARLSQITYNAEKNVEERRRALEILAQEVERAEYLEKSSERLVETMTQLAYTKPESGVLEEPRQSEAGEEAAAIVERFESMKMTAEDAANLMSDSFAGFFESVLTGSASAEEAFTNMMKGIFSTFISYVVKMLAFKAFFSLFTGGAGAALPGFSQGGEIPGAAYGLEVFGGTPGRDSVPALIGGNEAVIPSPTMNDLRTFLSRELSGGARRRREGINVFTLFSAGSDTEETIVGDYVARIDEGFSPNVIRGTL